MKSRRRIAAIALVVCSIAAVTITPAAGQSNDQKPKATEIGVTATEIHVAVAADVDNPFAPGVFKGSVDGVKAAAAFLNSKAGGGGLAGRKVVVDAIDTHLNANDSRNATIEACQNDLALVGGAMALLASVDDIVNCKDQAGQATGIPDLGSVMTGVPEQCSPMAFPSIGRQLDCATAAQATQTYYANQGPDVWLLKQNKKGLKGPMLVGSDSKDSVRGGTVLALAAQAAGIKADPSAVVAISGRDPQSAYTPIVQQMKSSGANYSLNSAAANQALLLRNEAELQGVKADDIVWECVSCYGNSVVTSNASSFEGEYQFLGFLPFEEGKDNKTLANFLTYMKKVGGTPDQFAAYSYSGMLAFAAAVNETVKANGINGITRSTLLTGLKSLTDFDAGGMSGTLNYKTGRSTSCFVMVQFTNGKWVRRYPTKKGTFDCNPKNTVALKADLIGS